MRNQEVKFTSLPKTGQGLCGSAVIPRERRVAVGFDPFQDLLAPEADVGLNADVRDESPLDIAVDGLHVYFQKRFKISGVEKPWQVAGIGIQKPLDFVWSAYLHIY